MKFHILHIILFLLITTKVASQKNTTNIKLVGSDKVYYAGDTIVLKFTQNNKIAEDLYISSSYGSTVVSPQITANSLIFEIPDFISKKSGWIYWNFTKSLKNTKGSFYVNPLEKVNRIETYLGPPSLVAGYKDYAMLVTIPLDTLDNPIKKGTLITVNKSFLNTQTHDSIVFDGMTGYDLIYTKPKTGRVFISAVCKTKNTKEHSLEILPNVPSDFNLSYSTTHNFADGNQIVKFKTSEIRDEYQNIVTNGTLVNFKIENNLGEIFQTYGTTINGIANAELIHPDYKQKWTVVAFVNQMATSNGVSLEFKEAISNFNIKYHQASKKLLISDFKSYMGQFIPDGLNVNVKILYKHHLIKEFNVQTENGACSIYLGNYVDKNKFPYTIKVTASDKLKQIELND
ncbi:hypothetical protein ACXGQW_09925 [Wenyingzhuangia sp. IMCC45533]